MAAIAVHGALLAAGDAAAQPPQPSQPEKPTATVPAQQRLNMANPASVYCGRVGGRLEIRKDAEGNESGWCHLPDGRVVEEWALFRGEAQGAPGAQQLQGEDETAPK